MGRALRTFQETTGERLLGQRPKAPKPLFDQLTERESREQAEAYLEEAYPAIRERFLCKSVLAPDGRETTRLEQMMQPAFENAIEHPEQITLGVLLAIAEGTPPKRPVGRPSKKSQALNILSLFKPFCPPTED